MKTTSSFSWGSQGQASPIHLTSLCQSQDHSTWMWVAVEPAAAASPMPAAQTSGPQPCPSPGGGYLTGHKAPTPQVWPPLLLGSWLLPSPAFARTWESSTAQAANYSASPFICWLGSLDFVICYAEVFFLTNLFTRFNSSIMFSF